MWARFVRMIRSIVGVFINLGEDPERILEQNIKDMQDKIPMMNEGLAKAKSGMIKLDMEAKGYERQINDLQSKIKAYLSTGKREHAGQLAVQMKRTQDALLRNREQFQAAQEGYNSMLAMRDSFKREMDRKIADARSAIQESKASEWKNELAGVFESFEVGGIDQTHDEMIQKLKHKSAEAEGKLAVAATSTEMQNIKLDEEAEAIEGQELLKQFELEMGIAAPEAAPVEGGREKTIGPKVGDKLKN